MIRVYLLMSLARKEPDDDAEEEVSKFFKRFEAWEHKRNEYLDPLYAEAGETASAALDASISPSDIDSDDDDDVDEDDEDDEDDDTHQPVKAGMKRKRTEDHQARRAEQAGVQTKLRNVVIGLPSSCKKCDHKCLEDVVRIETAFRKAQADRALDSLRTHLITTFVYRAKVKKGHAKPENRIFTRHQQSIARKEWNIQKAARDYRRAWEALRRLGFKDDVNYRPLLDSDIRPFIVATEDEELGQGKNMQSWIWQSLKFINSKDLAANFHKYAADGEYRARYRTGMLLTT